MSLILEHFSECEEAMGLLFLQVDSSTASSSCFYSSFCLFVYLFVWLLLFLSFKTGQGFLISFFKLLLCSLKFFVLISELACGGIATPGMNVGVEK